MEQAAGDGIRVESPFRMGRWHVDPRKNTIETDDGHRVHLEPKAMRVLVYLASHAGEDVERESLAHEVWSGARVSGSALTNAVWELRKALGDNSTEPDYIQTVPGIGYRLVTAVSAEPESASDRATETQRKASVLYAIGLMVAFLAGLLLATLLTR